MGWKREKEHGSEEDAAENSNFRHHGRVKLFEKVVTASDIKQYRLSIPKHHARRHFNQHSAGNPAGPNSSSHLCMEDDEGRVWKFKYTFWKSRRGYMLTSQWGRFVKVKGVSAGDVVSFMQSNRVAGVKLYIDCKKQGKSDGGSDPKLIGTVQGGRSFKLFGVYISTILIE